MSKVFFYLLETLVLLFNIIMMVGFLSNNFWGLADTKNLYFVLYLNIIFGLLSMVLRIEVYENLATYLRKAERDEVRPHLSVSVPTVLIWSRRQSTWFSKDLFRYLLSYQLLHLYTHCYDLSNYYENTCQFQNSAMKILYLLLAGCARRLPGN